MKRIAALVFVLALTSGAASVAQPGGRPPAADNPNCGHAGQPACDERGQRRGDERGQRDRRQQEEQAQRQAQEQAQRQAQEQEAQRQAQEQAQRQAREQEAQRQAQQRWSRGQRLPDQYRQDQYAVPDWRQRNLSAPPRGYRWMCYQGGNCYLVANNSGVIRERRVPDERETYWRQRYSRTYSYNDDLYYRECRNRSDPAGVLIGGLIGALLGRAVDDNRAGGTVAGIIIGAAVGAALTRDLDCDDRSYAYQTYYNALNRGQPGTYRWTNPQNNHRGDFRVRSYYSDQSGFQCANYSHTVYLDRRRAANGRACRQPDGAWVFLN